MKIWQDILNVFFPESCYCCTSGLSYNEAVCCVSCLHELPLTNFCFENRNDLETALYGRIPLQAGTALFYFYKGGNVQKLIYYLKYKGQQKIGVFTGNWLAAQMIQSGRFNEIQAIVGVPLHKKKEKKRGYNQVTTFGKTLSEQFGIPFYDKVLARVSSLTSQTKKIRFDRLKNVDEVFVLNDSMLLKNKHILLIDDVLTTGATLEACYKALSVMPNFKISIACMAYTK